MSIKELYKVFKSVKGCNSCLILTDDLQLELFGKQDSKLIKFRDKIMKISL